MSSQICASAAPISTKNEGIENVRRSITYHPSVWGDYFLAYTPDITDISVHKEEEHQKLKEEVKKLFTSTRDDSLRKLNLIDSVQRLGIGYHFEIEIENSLKYVHDDCDVETYCKQESHCNLHAVALWFRLLRQQGFHVSCSVFEKFKDPEGKFDEALNGDVQGLLSLYEAAQYRVHEEEILEEALTFSMTHLNSLVLRVNNSLATQIREALDMPIHKTLSRLGARRFISTYQQDEFHNELLLNFSKLDFNLLQKIYQKELHDLTRWRKALAVAEKLPFARDRTVEGYFWSSSMYFEPQYAFARKMVAKAIIMATIVDDIYDVRGTFDELQLFTDAIQRWNIDAIDQLPSYMQYAYKCLLDVYIEAEEELETIGQSSLVYYTIQEMQNTILAFFEEAKWAFNGYTPTLDEYMKVALESISLHITALAVMGEQETKEFFDSLESEPLFIRASNTIFRLKNDMAGHDSEDKITTISCYMNCKGVSKEDAYIACQEQVTNAWKDINKECLRPTIVPRAVIMRIVTLTRYLNLMYKDVDEYTVGKSKIKGYITDVLVKQLEM